MNYDRLKQTDFNGNYKYSNVVSAELASTFYFHLYPNPAGEYITIVTDQVFNHIGISDGTGSNLIEFKGEFGNKTVLHLTGLASGTYILKATSGNGSTQSIMFIKNVNDTK